MSLLPRLHEIFEHPALSERAGIIGVVVLEVALDRRDALVQRVENRVPEPLPRAPREETLDSVHPGCRGRSELKRPVNKQLFIVGDSVSEFDAEPKFGAARTVNPSARVSDAFFSA